MMDFNFLDEQEKLRFENAKMISELNTFLMKNKRLFTKMEYINSKYNEYGSPERINLIFDSLLNEYNKAKIEEKSLKGEHEKALQDINILPKAYEEIKKSIAELKSSIFISKYEIDQILSAASDIYRQAKESEEIVSKYQIVHKDYEKNSKILNDLKVKFEKGVHEKKILEKDLLAKQEIIHPLLRNESVLKEDLDEITERFKTQEVLTEEISNLKEIIAPLEKTISDWTNKIQNHNIKSEKMNDEIKSLKRESNVLSAELKENEALIGPFKELKDKHTKMQNENLHDSEQIEKLIKEIRNIKKENQELKTRAMQFEEVKKKMEGIII